MGSKSKFSLFVLELLLIEQFSLPYNAILCVNILLESRLVSVPGLLCHF